MEAGERCLKGTVGARFPEPLNVLGHTAEEARSYG